MFKHRKIFGISFSLLFMLVYACKSDKQDTSKPFINIESPKTSEVFYTYSNEEFNTEFFLKDNKALSQYRILVKSNFDNPIQTEANNSPAKAFSLVYVKNVDGTVANETVAVKVDQYCISGNYNLIIDCVDASGNQAEPVSLNFIVKNKMDSVGPYINIITPAEGSIFANDTTITLTLLFEDFRSDNSVGFVYDFTIKIYNISNQEEIFTFSQIINKKSPQSYIQILPLISEAGEYRLEIISRDDFNNLSEITRVFRVL